MRTPASDGRDIRFPGASGSGPPFVEFFRELRIRLLLLAVFCASFAVYAATSARTVTGEDSGELIAAAYTLGVAHPPGYPLWCLLAKAATLIPIGEVAFRVALLSALFGALTATGLAAVILLLTRSPVAAIAASLGFGFLRDQWSQAVIAEVYTLNTFFLAVTTLVLIVWSGSRNWRLLHLFAFLFGLSLTNHHTMLAAAPGFLAFLLIQGFRLLREWRQLLTGVGAFLAGLLPYVYLPIAASRDPGVNWGDPRTLGGVVDHVLRRQYAESATPAPPSADRFQRQLSVLWDHATGQGEFVVMVLGVLGLVYLLRRRFTLCVALLPLVFLSTVGIVLFTDFEPDYENAHAQRLFFVPAWFALAVAGGCLMAALLRLVPRRVSPVLSALLVVASAGTPLAANWTASDYSGQRLVADYARALLVPVERDAVLFPTSDHITFPLLYLRCVEGLRPDVTLADKYGYIDPAFTKTMKLGNIPDASRRSQSFRLLVETHAVTKLGRPCYFTQKHALPPDAGAALWSEGLWYRARPEGTTEGDVLIADRAAWAEIRRLGIDESAGPCDYTSRMILGDLRFAQARHAFTTRNPARGIALCHDGSFHGRASKEVQNNLGSLLAEQREHAEGILLFRRALALDGAYTMARRNLATALMISGPAEEAEAECRELLRQDPLDPVGQRHLAEITRRREAWPEAAYHLEQVGRIEGDYAAFRDAGLICLFELRDYERAKRLLRISLSIHPDQPEVREAEGRIRPVARGDEERSEGRSETDPGQGRAIGPKNATGSSGGPPVLEPRARNPLEGLVPASRIPSVGGGPSPARGHRP